MAETFFSGLKRPFGEVIEAKRFERMVKEIKLKVWVYNRLSPPRDLDRQGWGVS
jgi:hypothetical protein